MRRENNDQFSIGPYSNLAGTQRIVTREIPPLIIERQRQLGSLIEQHEAAAKLQVSIEGLEVMHRQGDVIRISTGDQLFFPRNHFVEDKDGRWRVLPGLPEAIRALSIEGRSPLDVALGLAKPLRNGTSKIDSLQKAYRRKKALRIVLQRS